MRQSRTYTRGKETVVDPDAYKTYRMGVAMRILRKRHLHLEDAWQLAAIPAFFLWVFRRPASYFKRKKIDRIVRKKLESNSNTRSS